MDNDCTDEDDVIVERFCSIKVDVAKDESDDISCSFDEEDGWTDDCDDEETVWYIDWSELIIMTCDDLLIFDDCWKDNADSTLDWWTVEELDGLFVNDDGDELDV